MKRIGALVVLLLVLLVGYKLYSHWYGGGAAGQGQQMGAMPALTASVEEKTFNPSFAFTGRVEAVTEAEVRPQVSGLVEKILFKEGDMVKKGQPLVVLDLRTFRAAAAQGAAQVEQAKLAYQRGVALQAQDAISVADLQNRKAAWQAAEAFAMQARVDLDHAEIKAPISGRIGRADITIGNVVTAGGGAPVITTIQQLDPMYVDFEVNEQTYLDMIGKDTESGMDMRNAPVAVGLASDGDDYPLEGKLAAVDNRFSDGTGALRMRAVLDNKNGNLIPGLFARVKLTVPVQTTAVLVNDAVIGTDQANRFVWKVGADNTAVYQKVTIDGLQDNMRVVTDGLKAGDKIVVNGLAMIHPGVPLRPIPASMETLQAVGAPAAASATEVSGTAGVSGTATPSATDAK
jgi:multidrug efflux system membrane fusion protein